MRTVDVKGTPFSVPDGWSDNAATIAASKYARPYLGRFESSFHEIAFRVSKEIYPTKQEWAEALYAAQIGQRFAFNSPVYFNLGVMQEPVLSACFILSVEDTMESIIDACATAWRIFKGGAGVGLDISPLREKGAAIRGVGGVSSGPLPLLAKPLDAIGQATRSGGVTRRAATMLTMRDWHPDVLAFIRQKAKIERMLVDLKSMGYRVDDMNSEVYEFINGQQANRAVRLSDAFMNTVKLDARWYFTSPRTDEVVGWHPAREMLYAIAESCWECGDPGVQFDDAIQRMHTIPQAGRINSSNPCSEYLSIDNSACNLSSQNLAKLWQPEEKKLDLLGLRVLTRRLVNAQDRLIDLASYPTETIAHNVGIFRQLGLGFTNLGGLLMLMGLPYDSEEGRAVAGALAGIITSEGYFESSALAEKGSAYNMPYTLLGPSYRESTYCVLLRHADALDELAGHLWDLKRKPLDVFDALSTVVDLQSELLRHLVDDERPIWNSQISLVAPTGTISFLMDAATTGIEPAYALVYEKELVGGGRMTVPTNTVGPALASLGYSKDDVGHILFRLPQKKTLVGLVKDEHLPIFQAAADPQGNVVAPHAHLAMCASVQPHISGAISKTVNLPSGASIEAFERAIVQAHALGLKAVTFYREGSKATQPLSVAESVVFEVMPCGACSTPMVQTGTCWVCPSCGEGGACS